MAAEPQRYAALSHLEVRAGAGKTSEKVGDLAEGAVIEVMSTEEVEGTTQVQFDQGWVSVRAGSGQVLLELVTTSESDLLISGAIGETEVPARPWPALFVSAELNLIRLDWSCLTRVAVAELARWRRLRRARRRSGRHRAPRSRPTRSISWRTPSSRRRPLPTRSWLMG